MASREGAERRIVAEQPKRRDESRKSKGRENIGVLGGQRKSDESGRESGCAEG